MVGDDVSKFWCALGTSLWSKKKAIFRSHIAVSMVAWPPDRIQPCGEIVDNLGPGWWKSR